MRVRLAQLCAVLLACAALSGCALVGFPGTNVGGCYPQAWFTPAATTSALTRFVAMGDFGTPEGGHNRRVAMAMDRFLATTDIAAERVFELGDNFYYHGLIGEGVGCGEIPGPEAAVAQQAFSVLGPFAFLRDRGVTLTALAGNHDYGCDGRGLVNQLDIDRWLPETHHWGSYWDPVSGAPREIVLGNGAVQVIALDSQRMIAEPAFREASAKRLEELLLSGRDRHRWRVLAGHHPLRTYGTHDGAWWEGALPKLFSFLLLPSHALAAVGVPPFDLLNQQAYSVRYVQYREAVEHAVNRSDVAVALFLAGHDHQLQLLAPTAPGQPFVVVSGAAAKCSPVRAGSDTLFAAARFGFATVTAYSDRLDVEFIGTTDCAERVSCADAGNGGPALLFRYSIVDGVAQPLASCRRAAVPKAISDRPCGRVPDGEI
jgi:hypothetical protein